MEHLFGGNGWYIFAYFKCRSRICMWYVCDLDLGSMINLSTRVNKTLQNSTQSKQPMWKVCIMKDHMWLWLENITIEEQQDFIIFKNKNFDNHKSDC